MFESEHLKPETMTAQDSTDTAALGRTNVMGHIHSAVCKCEQWAISMDKHKSDFG